MEPEIVVSPPSMLDPELEVPPSSKFDVPDPESKFNVSPPVVIPELEFPASSKVESGLDNPPPSGLEVKLEDSP